MNDSVDRESCYFCGEGHAEALEEHHLVPQRFNGSDEPENTVWLCGSCHNKVEQLYDDEFYKRLGVSVEELRKEPAGRGVSGTEVKPSESQSREIPAGSPHIEFEHWIVHTSISEILSGEVEGLATEFIQRHEEKILSQYESEREDAIPIEEYYDELPEWVVEDAHEHVEFQYVHNELDQFPVVRIVNNNKDRIDRELKFKMDEENEAMTKSPSGKGKGGEKTESKTFGRYIHNEPEEYPPNYRLHCAYCHSVYSQNQHPDLARHLRLRHGIDNPYELSDTAFGKSADMSKLLPDRQ